MTAKRGERRTIQMRFARANRIPEPGETVIMAGSFGVNYAVTVHRIKHREENGEWIDITADCTRRALPQPLAQHWLEQWREGVEKAERDIAENGMPF